MRRLASLLLFGVSGLATGVAVALFLLAFMPKCGYDCENHSFGVAFLSVVGCTLTFLLLGYAFTRGTLHSFPRALVVSAALTVVAIVAASGGYVFQLYGRYRAVEAARPVVADVDFMYMAITTRDVQTYTNAESGVTRRASVIPQWQRCAIDGASCEVHPRQAHMRCKSGVVYVNEPDWNAFSLIPRENLAGANPIRSMSLCAADNETEP